MRVVSEVPAASANQVSAGKQAWEEVQFQQNAVNVGLGGRETRAWKAASACQAYSGRLQEEAEALGHRTQSFIASTEGKLWV